MLCFHILRGYYHRYSSLTYVLYACGACQQLIAPFPVIPVLPGEQMTDSQTADFWDGWKRKQQKTKQWTVSESTLMKSMFREDWSQEDKPTSKTCFINIFLGGGLCCIFRYLNSYMLSQYVYLIRVQKTGFHQERLRLFFMSCLFGFSYLCCWLY